MNFLHTRVHLNGNDIAVADCSHQCNVKLMDDYNFSLYRSGRSHNYYGGFYDRLPAKIPAPATGYWNLVLDLGGGSATVRHSFSVIRR